MRKIIKLRGEILVICFISIVLSIVLGSIVMQTYRDSSYEKKIIHKSAISRNKNYVNNVKDILNTDSKDEEEIKKNFKEKKHELIEYGVDNMYIVDNEGNVLDVLIDNGVTKIKFENKKSKLVVYGMRFTARNVIKIRDNFYIVSVNADYCRNDTDKFFVWLILAILIFVVLMRGRVKYIGDISKRVREISAGNLDVKVPAKYKNELTSLSEDINTMAENLKDEDIKQKEFITNISHDLRTPLTTILGYLKMIEEKKYEDEEQLNTYIGIINRKSVYLKSLVDDFFNYSKLMSKDIEINMTKINVNECLKELLFEEEKAFADCNLTIKSDIEDAAMYINGEPMLIARVFENLFSNACKYSKADTEVSIKAYKDNENMIFNIYNVPSDELSEEDVNNFFNRLYKKDKSRKSAGNGLGLAITKEIVKIHNGSIEAKKQGEGVIFTISFPLL